MADKEDSTIDKQKQQAEADSNYDADEDSSSDEEEEEEEDDKVGRDSDDDSGDESDDGVFENTYESNTKIFTDIMNSESYKKALEKEDQQIVNPIDVFDFPKDPEQWAEEDLQEIWAEGPVVGDTQKTGWDPKWATQEDVRYARNQIKYGQEPALAPFYLPFRKGYPSVPFNHHDISSPKTVIEELDRIEEFLKWVSYIFEDGSSYEGTVWDDYAQGKGVYVGEYGLIRYEGEWMQNQMEGHGVIEVDVPAREPRPGSKLEKKMRAKGKIISRDYMSPEDREWLEMDIEDSYNLAGGRREIPFDENYEWIKLFGKKPEQGRYRYAGQWKHGRMHGCGVYEVNERPLYGRFYFGELLEDSTGCDEDVSTVHAGIAEVAAAKARMFINKPDGMVREQRGPYSDPQHPYLYEEEDVWMAPGFINQFYEVPDYWKTYAHEVDEEREMWLNSFYKAPLRIPMPAELEHWWSKDEDTEFVLVNCDPVPDPEDPSRLVYKEDPLILHVPTGRLINYIEDENHGVRLFWQPVLKEGQEELEEVNKDKLNFLPLGFDEFFGRKSIQPKRKEKEGIVEKVPNALMSVSDKLKKWVEEKKKKGEMKLKLIEKELEFMEAELSLEETIEDMEIELKKAEKEEEKRTEISQPYEIDTSVPDAAEEDEVEEEDDDDDDDDDDADADDDDDDADDDAPTSFGSVADQDSKENDKGNKRGKSPFSTLSLSFAPSNLVSTVPLKLQESFASWKNGRRCPTSTTISPHSSSWNSTGLTETLNSVSFPVAPIRHANLKTNTQGLQRLQKTSIRLSPLHSVSRISSNFQASSGHTISQGRQRSDTHNQQQRKSFKVDVHDILSLHFPIDCLGTLERQVFPFL